MNRAYIDKIVDIEALLPILAELRQSGRRIVQCHGCFDVVHPGHIRHLADAAAAGEVLLVSVTADPQVTKRAQGPFVPQELRCENLAALSMVDYVIIDPESWAGPLLERIRPDVYVKGLEYLSNNDPRFLREKEIVVEHGGEVLYTSGEVVYSSTRLQQDHFDQNELWSDRLRALGRRHGLSQAGLARRLEQMRGVRVVVVGDLIVDHYVECEHGEVTTEAPVLQVSPIDERRYVGGAGVLALHAASLGAEVSYVGFVPPAESAGLDLGEALRKAGVTVSSLPCDSALVKTRYLVDGQKVFKVNRCRPMTLNSSQESAWLSRLAERLESKADGLIAVDFGYGTINRPRIRQAAALALEFGAKVFGDTSSSRAASLGKFFGAKCDTIYPSESEARAYLGEPELGLPLLASKLFSHEMADAVALTLGARGLVLFERNRQSTDVDGTVRYLPEYLPALTHVAVDPMGAGDALTTAASLARLAGAGRVEALAIGSLAAAVVVGKLGNEPVGRDPILRLLERRALFDDA